MKGYKSSLYLSESHLGILWQYVSNTPEVDLVIFDLVIIYYLLSLIIFFDLVISFLGIYPNEWHIQRHKNIHCNIWSQKLGNWSLFPIQLFSQKIMVNCTCVLK